MKLFVRGVEEIRADPTLMKLQDLLIPVETTRFGLDPQALNRACRGAVMHHGGAPGPGTSTDDETAERAIVTWLKSSVHPGHNVISICTGALIAARAGLLDGHCCTTHYLS